MKARGCRRSALIVSKRSCRVFEEWKQNRLVKSCALEPEAFLPRETSKKEYKLWTRPLQICLHAVGTAGCQGSFKK